MAPELDMLRVPARPEQEMRPLARELRELPPTALGLPGPPLQELERLELQPPVLELQPPVPELPQPPPQRARLA